MSVGGPPSSGELQALGVTSVSTLLACRLHLSFAKDAEGGDAGHPSSPQAVLGEVCHAALEYLVRDGGIGKAEWEANLEDGWVRALGDARLDDDPSGLPGFAIARARLRNAAGRLRELLSKADEPMELVCEEPMTALDDRLRGRPDLVVRAPKAHWIIDYKTGGVLEPESDLPKAAYAAQLRLYAVLEQAQTGEWPSRGFLVPFSEETVEVALDQAECEEAASAFIDTLDQYNATAPQPQPARPSPENCRWCEFATRCDAVWAECDESWAPMLLLARGEIVDCVRTAIGTTTIVLDVQGGALPAGKRIAIAGRAHEEHPVLGALEPGQVVRLSKLRKGQGTTSFILPRWGRLAVEG